MSPTFITVLGIFGSLILQGIVVIVTLKIKNEVLTKFTIFRDESDRRYVLREVYDVSHPPFHHPNDAYRRQDTEA